MRIEELLSCFDDSRNDGFGWWKEAHNIGDEGDNVDVPDQHPLEEGGRLGAVSDSPGLELGQGLGENVSQWCKGSCSAGDRWRRRALSVAINPEDDNKSRWLSDEGKTNVKRFN